MKLGPLIIVPAEEVELLFIWVASSSDTLLNGKICSNLPDFNLALKSITGSAGEVLTD